MRSLPIDEALAIVNELITRNEFNEALGLSTEDKSSIINTAKINIMITLFSEGIMVRVMSHPHWTRLCYGSGEAVSHLHKVFKYFSVHDIPKHQIHKKIYKQVKHPNGTMIHDLTSGYLKNSM